MMDFIERLAWSAFIGGLAVLIWIALSPMLLAIWREFL